MQNGWNTPQRPLIIGHRGASAHAPENSLEAFRLALAHGADGIEFDVQLSRDGVPMVIHDDTLDRTTSGHGAVSAQSAAEIQTVDLGNGETVPTLAQLFDLYSDAPEFLFNVEIKAQASEAVAAVLDVIAHAKVAARTVISSFDHATVRRALQLAPPDIGVGFLRHPEMPELADWFTAASGTRLLADHPHWSLVTETTHQHGLPINVWTVDDLDVTELLIARRAHAIITNDPKKLRQAHPHQPL